MRAKKNAAGSGSAASADQWRLTVSCRSSEHAADLSLTNNDGKQTKDDDEKDKLELHVQASKLYS
jgi:hypothetical protein